MTRAFCAISHGRFAEATQFNPLSWLFYPGALALLAVPFLHLPVGRGRRDGAAWYVGGGMVLVILLYGFWAVRLMGFAL